ncbi:MAG: CaiB/BaiF CoA transferase family protein [Acidimicrobiales bacterium]
MTQIMKGIRVLEVAEHTFVPAASAVLADWGAEVIKIEHAVRGDAMRGLASSGVMDLSGQVHALLEHSNRGKQSIGIDLTTDDGVDLAYRLAATCDVFLTNKPPAVRDKLRIAQADIEAHAPNIIYAAGTAHGAKGPDGNSGGYDMTGFWCRSGAAFGNTPVDADYPGMQPAPAFGDSIGGMTIAGGIAGALLHRERTGEAVSVDVSLLGTGMWAMGAGIALSLVQGQPWSAPPASLAAFGNPLVGSFPTADDRWLNLTMLQAFAYWPDWCELVGAPELIADERFATAEDLAANAQAAAALVAEHVARHTLAEWTDKLQGFRGQWAPIQNSLEVADDPQAVANDYVMELETADGVAFKLVTAPVQFGGEASPPRRAPDFHEHGDAILTDQLGLDWDTVVDLKVRGIVA